jgi:hypothetical protein
MVCTENGKYIPVLYVKFKFLLQCIFHLLHN